MMKKYMEKLYGLRLLIQRHIKYDIKNGDYIQIKNTKKKELKIKKIKLYNQEVDIKNYNWD